MSRQESPLRWLVSGALVGAAAMFFFDPVQGRRRRAILMKKLKSTSAPENTVDDRTLEARVRSEFGRRASHAKSIKVEVHTGIVTLYGPVLEDEVPSIITCVRSVKGVREVINQLDPHRTSERIPGLQGEGKTYLQ